MIATAAPDSGPDPEDRNQTRLRELYERGVRLMLAGEAENALDCFKQIYEVDNSFRDIAEIVEDSYLEPTSWLPKHQARFRKASEE
jgi:hypothetical protein